MNSTQTSRTLKEKGINGFDNVAWEFKAPEVIGNDKIFSNCMVKCNISKKEYEDNIALFVLFRNHNPFKDRMKGKTVDSWLSKDNFQTIAQECYDLLEAQPDLEEWQIQLKDTFRSLI